MQKLWGALMILSGLLMFVGGLTKSEFIVYRLFVSRAKSAWGDHVHSFFIVSGLAVMVFGLLFALGYIGRNA
ncbi:MAG: hypothetical protein ABJZ55_04585 [Fuerstiella sp.]